MCCSWRKCDVVEGRALGMFTKEGELDKAGQEDTITLSAAERDHLPCYIISHIERHRQDHPNWDSRSGWKT